MELCEQLCRSMSSSEESFSSSSEEEGPNETLLAVLCESIQTPLGLGVLAAAASLVVYLPQEKQALCLSGSSDVVFHVEENAVATSFAKDGLWVVAFRGTELSQWKDVADDVDVWRKPLYWAPSSYVHRGFLHHYLKLQASVLKEFLLQTQKQRGIDRVLITGHSLGGTSAYLTASFFAFLCQSLMFSGRLVCKTFGCPRIGDAGFFRWCSSALSGTVDLACYVNSSDLVARVPLQLSENWVHRSIVFRRKEAPFKAHSMENYFKATLQQELLETT